MTGPRDTADISLTSN